MSSPALSGIVFACGSAETLLGMLLRSRLPDHHLSPESRDVVKLAMGIIGTMTALVLGLLIASAKDSFDAQRNGVAQLAANAVMLDRFLAFYSPEAQPTRELLRASMADMLRRTWPEDERAAGQTRAKSWTEGRNDELYVRVLTLEPKTDTQRTLQAQALRLVGETRQSGERPFGETPISVRAFGALRSGAARSP